MSRDEVALVALSLVMLVLLHVLINGCAPARPPLPPQERAWASAAALQWRDQGLPWRPSCDRLLAGLQADRAVERCPGRVWGCLEGHTLHVAPDVEQERGAGAYRNTLLHELGHGLVACSGLDPYGDPGHMEAGVWESAGERGWLRSAQRRAGGLP